MAAALGAAEAGRPVLTVVGSKGKGTAAVYASATLAAAGLRVCTVTSPGLRGNRDRIRVDGRAVAEDAFAALAGRLEAALPAAPGRGHLSPSGLFTLAGVLHAADAGADALVLEAGMGGQSDEVSLYPPLVAAITPIFAEHLGVLGDSVTEIAAEKAGIVGPGTRAVVAAPQSAEVARVLAGLDGAGAEPPPALPAALLPAGLGRDAARTGYGAALRLLAELGRPGPAPARLRAVLGSVRLPGRLSWHRAGGTEVLADSAIDRRGVAVALAAARARWGSVDRVLVCLPDHKDLDGAVAELDDLPVTFVRLPQEHLRFERALPASWQVVEAADLALDGLGRHVVALGTVYFVGRVLELVGADTERLFDV
ncbi:hypothetical protein K1Y72_16965 [Actinomadura sp. PM05-2]|uniref:Bifunctional folylpolyglutamate synthase/dihydrofolate synthase n=2 Tax=Actinomadura parmotrematis TaxID=2864039 RepID=A0ABS7FVT1_9ACTN|nr:hypothetical protein [Actinomadura parmotrematis]